MKKHYEISLMDRKMINYMKENDGLCMKKFHADIITDNIDYSSLKEEDIITIDNMKIKIAKVGKSCFPDCNLIDKPCLLSKNVAFGNIQNN